MNAVQGTQRLSAEAPPHLGNEVLRDEAKIATMLDEFRKLLHERCVPEPEIERLTTKMGIDLRSQTKGQTGHVVPGIANNNKLYTPPGAY